MLRLSVAWVTCCYSQQVIIITLIIKTGQGSSMGIGGCNRLCPMAMGQSLVALFYLSTSIEDRTLLWMVVRSQIYYPEYILAYGSRRARYSLVVGFSSFWTNWLEAVKGGGLSTALRPGLKCGAWSPSLDRDLDPTTGVEWVGLICALGTSKATLILIMGWSYSTWRYDLAMV
jgi:hypothetical protein